jgi:hypothetical protein
MPRPLPETKPLHLEVALGAEELRRLGVETFADLTELDFPSLQGEFFRFMVPTFVSHPAGPVAAFLETERRTKFLTAGVVGLLAMDQALARERKGSRKALIRMVRQSGKNIKAASRTGSGLAGTMVAYADMNGRIETALRHLGERVRG